MIKYFILILICVISYSTLKAQCYEDYFGFWETDNGEYIALVEPDFSRGIKSNISIGNKNIKYHGVYFYEDGLINIVSYIRLPEDEADKNGYVRKSFKFKVLAVDKQSMLIMPISEEIQSIFGAKEIRLFNTNFISFDTFKFDSICYTNYYIDLQSKYVIKINKKGKMDLSIESLNKGGKNKHYTANLGVEETSNLIDFILKSKIPWMSNCDLKRYCIDCYSVNLQIFYNNRMTYYGSSQLHSSVVPLLRLLDKLILETKWIEIKSKTDNN